MSTFVVKARDTRGQAVQKTIEADSPQQVRAKLREQGLFVTEIAEKKNTDDIGAMLSKFLKLGTGMPKPGDKVKVKLRDMTIFSRQFATMINAGVSLVRSLNIMAEQTENKKFQSIILQVKDKVEQGSSLSDSLREWPCFSKLYTSMVRAGEAGGVLDGVLQRLADFLEAQDKLASQIKSAMTYPVVVLFIASAIFIFLLTFVLPIFKDMFDAMGGKLPAFTAALMGMSAFMRQFWYIVFGGAFGIYWSFKKFISTPFGSRWFDDFALKAPVFGPLTRKVAVARFTRTLGTLLKSGVPLVSSLEIVQDTAGNIHIAEAVEKVRLAVLEGEGMVKPLEQAKVFPAMVVQMIAIGEETGAVDAMLEKIANFYDNEVEQSVKALTSLLEPLMMVGIGGMVGSIIIGMYLPMFSIIGAIK
ncbi:MAG: type II secretion system F family protein [Candidatus Sericytochromatia bacterium]|nr:type II secretion system F family protein [Candidatus Sericytochromatia bacterium]